MVTIVDDFEDGDVAEWTGHYQTAIVINNTVSLNGTYSGEQTDGASNRAISHTSGDAIRCHVRYDSEDTSAIELWDSGGTIGPKWGSNNGYFGHWDETNTFIASTAAIATGTWYTVEFQNFDFTNNTYDVLIDGASHLSNVPFRNSIGEISSFSLYSGPGGSAFIDDIVTDTPTSTSNPAPGTVDDFEDGDVSGWTVGTTPGIVADGTTVNAGSYSGRQDSSGVSYRSIGYSGVGAVECYIRADDVTDDAVIELRESSTIGPKFGISGGNFGHWDDTNTFVSSGTPASAGTWYKLTFANLDFANNTYDAGIDGAEVAAGIPFKSGNNLSKVDQIATYKGGLSRSLYVDDIEALQSATLSSGNSSPTIDALAPADGAEKTIHELPEDSWYRCGRTNYDFGRVANKYDFDGQSWNLIGDPAVAVDPAGPTFNAWISTKDGSGNYHGYNLTSTDGYTWTIANAGNEVRAGMSPCDAVFHNGEWHVFWIDIAGSGYPPCYTKTTDPTAITDSNTTFNFITAASGEDGVEEIGATVVDGTWHVGYEFYVGGEIYSGLATGPDPLNLTRPYGGGYKLVPNGPAGSWWENDTGDPDPMVINGVIHTFSDARTGGKENYKINLMTGTDWGNLSQSSHAPVFESGPAAWDAHGVGDIEPYWIDDHTLGGLYEASDSSTSWVTQLGLAIAKTDWVPVSVTASGGSGVLTVTIKDAADDSILGVQQLNSGDTATFPIGGLTNGELVDWYAEVTDGTNTTTSATRTVTATGDVTRRAYSTNAGVYQTSGGAYLLGNSTSGTDLTIDDFEDNDLAEYDTTTGFSLVTSPVSEGTYALQGQSSGTQHIMRSSSGLANYPQRGDTIEFKTRLDTSTAKISLLFFGDGSGSNYAAQVSTQDDWVALWKDNYATTLASSTGTIPTGEWLTGTIETYAGGTLTLTLTDSSGAQVATVTATDSAYSSGAVGWVVNTSGASGQQTVYVDGARIIGT